MKFEAIKAWCKLELARQVAEERAKPGLTSACAAFSDITFNVVSTEEARQEHLNDILKHGSRMIDAWDVRCVGRLLDLYPDAWPEAVGKPVCAEIDDAGEWVVRVVA